MDICIQYVCETVSSHWGLVLFPVQTMVAQVRFVQIVSFCVFFPTSLNLGSSKDKWLSAACRKGSLLPFHSGGGHQPRFLVRITWDAAARQETKGTQCGT